MVPIIVFYEVIRTFIKIYLELIGYCSKLPQITAALSLEFERDWTYRVVIATVIKQDSYAVLRLFHL